MNKSYYVILEDIEVTKEQYKALRNIDHIPAKERDKINKNFLKNKLDDGSIHIFGFMDRDNSDEDE